MISLSQIQLLEEKVESAVARIVQLNQEKEALARRCLQLEEENKRLQDNLLNFEQDQERIEQGIIKALDRLNVVENSVLQAVAHQSQPANEVQVPPTNAGQQANHGSATQEQIPSSETGNNRQQQTLQNPENDCGLVPMFSEEVVSTDLTTIETEERALQEPNPSFNQNPNNDLFTGSQDNSHQDTQEQNDSAQLDIF